MKLATRKMMKNVNQQQEYYIWIPARVLDEVSDEIDSIAKVMGARRHEVVSAAIKAGLGISPYELAVAKVLNDRAGRLD